MKGIMDMLGGFGGMADIEAMGKDFVAHMQNTAAAQAAILANQKAIMEALEIADKFQGAAK